MKYLIANWKMNMNSEKITSWTSKWNSLVASETVSSNLTVVVAASFPFLHVVPNIEQVQAAAQTVSAHEKGSHTGEVSATQIKDFCSMCIVGHSERRESSETVIQQIQNCLTQEIIPVACFENEEDAKTYSNYTKLLAWEDPANISKNGVYAETNFDEIAHTMKRIKSFLQDDVEVLYGGSVNPDNIDRLLEIPEIDGFLVGSASLDANDFYRLMKQMTL